MLPAAWQRYQLWWISHKPQEQDKMVQDEKLTYCYGLLHARGQRVLLQELQEHVCSEAGAARHAVVC